MDLVLGQLIGLAPALFDLGPGTAAPGIPHAAFGLGWTLLGTALSPPR